MGSDHGSKKHFSLTDQSDARQNQDCSYGMDSLDRIANVNCVGSWAQAFTYDAFGNINKNAPANPTSGQITSTYAPAYNAQTNQVATGGGAQYDLIGNQTSSPTLLMAWNANSQLVVVNNSGAIYDAAGRVVEVGDAVAGHSATGSAGSITIGGAGEPLSPARTLYNGSGTVSIGGPGEQSKVLYPPLNGQAAGCGELLGTPYNSPTSYTCYDSGGGALSITGYASGTPVFQASFPIGYGDSSATASNLAATLVNAINQSGTSTGLNAALNPHDSTQLTVGISEPSSSPIQAYVISGGIGCGGAFQGCSFSMTTPGGVASNPSTTPAVTDTGTISATINGTLANYSWGASDTQTSVLNGLAQAINAADGSFLTATASGSSIQLTSLGTGAGKNWPVNVMVTSSLNTQAAFGAIGTAMTGGVTAYPGAADSGIYTTFVYTPDGDKLATLTNGSLVSADVPLPGGATAIYNGSGFNYFRHADWLGSSRLATMWNHLVYSKTAYAPFGETYNEFANADRSFTGQDQDPISGDYTFLFRKLDPAAGRWLSPDPSGLAYADLTSPQSLNLYAYVGNSPINRVDTDGLQYTVCGYGDASQQNACPTYDDYIYENIWIPEILQSGVYVPPARTSGTALCSFGSCAYITYTPDNALLYGIAPQSGPVNSSPYGLPYLPTAPNNEHKNPFLCGSEAAGKISLAGGLSHIPGLGSGVGGFIVNAIGGNAFSGATDLIHSVATGEGGGHSVFYNMGQSVIAGPTQGFGAAFGGSIGRAIESSPLGADIVSVGLKAIPLVGEYASGIGEAKLIYDGVTYFGATAGCALGIVH